MHTLTCERNVMDNIVLSRDSVSEIKSKDHVYIKAKFTTKPCIGSIPNSYTPHESLTRSVSDFARNELYVYILLLNFVLVEYCYL